MSANKTVKALRETRALQAERRLGIERLPIAPAQRDEAGVQGLGVQQGGLSSRRHANTGPAIELLPQQGHQQGQCE